ncbi:MAG: nucleotidyltransferase domain-containing protein [Melioribacteraceae bacterium]
MIKDKIKYSEEDLKNFCFRNHIKKLSFFGSVLTEKFTNKSDIDILVEFEDDQTPGLLSFARMEIELTEMIGRKVDLRTAEELSKYFRSDVVREAQVKYEVD